MRALFVIVAAIFAGSNAFANVTCSLVASDPANQNVYDIQLATISLSPSNNQDDVQFAYIKPDRTVVRLTYKEVKNKKDFSDLDHSTFYTFELMTNDDLQIGVGDVDVSRKDVRKLGTVVVGGESMAVFDTDQFVATCAHAN